MSGEGVGVATENTNSVVYIWMVKLILISFL